MYKSIYLQHDLHKCQIWTDDTDKSFGKIFKKIKILKVNKFKLNIYMMPIYIQ